MSKINGSARDMRKEAILSYLQVYISMLVTYFGVSSDNTHETSTPRKYQVPFGTDPKLKYSTGLCAWQA